MMKYILFLLLSSTCQAGEYFTYATEDSAKEAGRGKYPVIQADGRPGLPEGVAALFTPTTPNQRRLTLHNSTEAPIGFSIEAGKESPTCFLQGPLSIN